MINGESFDEMIERLKNDKVKPATKEELIAKIDHILDDRIPNIIKHIEESAEILKQIKELASEPDKNKVKIVGLFKMLPYKLIPDGENYNDLLGISYLRCFHVSKLSRDNYEAVKRSKDVSQEEIDTFYAKFNEDVAGLKQLFTDKFNFSLSHAPSHGVALDLLKARLLKEVYDNTEPGEERDAKLKIVAEITVEDIKSLYIRAEEQK